MRYRKLTSSGDMTFGNGQQDFYRDVPEAVGQAAQSRLLLWLGEWFLDTDEGTRYMQGILGKKSVEEASITIVDRILGTQGAVAVEDFQAAKDPDTRRLTVTSSLDTIYGPTAIEVENYGNY